MKKQKKHLPVTVARLPEGGRCRDQQERRDKYQSVCDDGGCRESVRYENCRVFRHARGRGRS